MTGTEINIAIVMTTMIVTMLDVLLSCSYNIVYHSNSSVKSGRIRERNNFRFCEMFPFSQPFSPLFGPDQFHVVLKVCTDIHFD